MNLNDFHYDFPEKLIAHKPCAPRDRSRLLVLDRATGAITHTRFSRIGTFLRKGDVIVLNNSKVFPARLTGIKMPSGGKAEILLVRPITRAKGIFEWSKNWHIIGKPRVRMGQEIVFSKNLRGKIIAWDAGKKIIAFNASGEALAREVNLIGTMPTPPYIKSALPAAKLKRAYQTVYARKIGSIAAPTAGFHFTAPLIAALMRKGIAFYSVTLHVGPGTFQPVTAERVEDFSLMSEWAEIDARTKNALNAAKKNGRRIITVGTTATRTIESFARNGTLRAGAKFTDIFIYPGYTFAFTDAILTNFHLPKSTPLLLACAFAGKDLILKSYKEAIAKKYRLFSFGDAMLII